MLLGQLYAYSASINKIPSQIKPEQLNSLEILGLDAVDLSKLADISKTSDLSGQSLNFELKALFIDKYQQVLDQANLQLASATWKFLTSPKSNIHVDSDSWAAYGESTNPYVQEVYKWSDGNFPNSDWLELLNDGLLSTNENSYAIYYGLAILHKLSTNTNTATTSVNLYLPASNKSHSLNPTPIIVVCPSLYSPLFVNLGCKFVPPQNQENLLLSLENELKNNLNILTVLMVGQDILAEKFIKKSLPQLNIISLEWNLEVSKNKGFFDDLAMQSLGVKL